MSECPLHSPTDPRTPPTDALGHRYHVFVDTGDLPLGRGPLFLETFAGGGGLTRGFVEAGCIPAVLIERELDPAETCLINFPGAALLVAPIEELTSDELVAALEGAEVELLIGGPPCQAVSIAGRRRTDDLRNATFGEFVRLVGLLRPHAVLAENVPGLLTMPEGPLDELLRGLAEVGYPNASVLELNAVDYGVPQRRRRVIIVANRHGWLNPYPLPTVLPSEYARVRDAIGDLVDEPENPWLHRVRLRRRRGLR